MLGMAPQKLFGFRDVANNHAPKNLAILKCLASGSQWVPTAFENIEQNL